MEVTDFWGSIEIPEEDLQYFREIDIVKRITLYENNLYLEYYIYCSNIKSTYRYDEKLKKAMDKKAVLGFSSEDSRDKYSYEESTFSQIRSCFQYFSYEEMTGNKINDFSEIIEIGAGCGDFCKFIFDMGYKGKYTIVDLPEIMPLAKYNLRQYPVNFSEVLPDINNKFIISTWGLSETMIETRPDLRRCSGYLLTYQRNIWGLDNKKYFNQFNGYKRELSWLPWDEGSELLVL